MKLPHLLVKKPKRSNFDLSHTTRFTAKPGVLYPILCHDMLPGEDYKLDISSLIKTYPMLAPLMGTFKVQFDIFKSRWRYYIPHMNGQDRNAVTPDTKIPQVFVNGGFDPLDGDDVPIFHPSCVEGSLFDFLGIPPGTQTVYLSGSERPSACLKFPAIWYKTYWDIYRSYYINQQEEKFYTVEVVNPTYSVGYDKSKPITELTEWNRFVLSSLPFETYYNSGDPTIFGHCTVFNSYNEGDDEYVPYPNEGKFFTFEYCGVYDSILVSDIQNFNSGDVFLLGFSKSYDVAGDVLPIEHPLPKGLACRTYRNDYITSVLNSSRASSDQHVIVGSSGGQQFVTVSEITLANKLQTLQELTVAAGDRYADWLRAQFGVNAKDDLMMPDLIGSVSTWMNFQDIIQTSDSADASSPLGSMAGRGVSVLDSNHTFNIHAEEHETVMVMMSIVPIVDYYQGMRKENLKRTFADIFVPALDNIGFQPLMLTELYASNPDGTFYHKLADGSYALYADSLDSGEFDSYNNLSVGKQPAWLEYKTALNQLHGKFTTSLRYWTNARQMFEPKKVSGTPYVVDEPAIERFSSYIDPAQWNYAFADADIDAENFMVQVHFNAFAKLPMSKNLLRKL